MLRCCAHRIPLALLVVNVACATTPPPPPLVVPFETKMSWILRLEDQRILRDAAMPIVPPPVTQGRRNVLPPPPPPPDLIRLLEDGEARIRRRAAIAVGRVGLPEAVPALVRLLQTDTDPEVRQMAAFGLGLIGDQSAVEPLRAAVADPLPLVAGRAAEALGLLNDTASAPGNRKDGGGSRHGGLSCGTRRRPRRSGWRCRRVQAWRLRAGPAEKLRCARGVGARPRRAAATAVVARRVRAAAHRRQTRASGAAHARAGRERLYQDIRGERPRCAARSLRRSCAAAVDRRVARGERVRASKRFAPWGASAMRAASRH